MLNTDYPVLITRRCNRLRKQMQVELQEPRPYREQEALKERYEEQIEANWGVYAEWRDARNLLREIEERARDPRCSEPPAELALQLFDATTILLRCERSLWELLWDVRDEL